jgi:allantoinase
MSAAPAKLAGLDHRKGKIAPGYDADLVVWDPDAEFSVKPELILHRHKLTPYSGLSLAGRTELAIVQGKEAGRSAVGQLILGDG